MRKLWNRPPIAVWSLSTKNSSGQSNMNICTYVTATSLKPKLLTIAVYHGTQTHKNISVGSTVLLQLLTEELASIVRICGQQSGRTIDKLARLRKRYEIQQHNGLQYLAVCAGFSELRIVAMHEVGVTIHLSLER